MSELISKFLHLLTDKTTSFIKRTGFFLLCLFFVLLANDTFNFSFNHRTNQKIEQLKSIYALYPKNTLDTNKVKQTLTHLEDEVLNRKALISKVKNIYSDVMENRLTLIQKYKLEKFISANVVFVLLMIIFLFTEKNKTQIKNLFVGLSVIAIITNFLLLLIPTFDNIIWNHVINISFCILLIFGIAYYENRIKN